MHHVTSIVFNFNKHDVFKGNILCFYCNREGAAAFLFLSCFNNNKTCSYQHVFP